MKITSTRLTILLISTGILLTGLCSCLTSKKMDVVVAEQYGNQMPKVNKKSKADVIVNSVYPLNEKALSTTIKKTSHFLPLIVYWQFDYRHTCTLNPQIAVSNFTNTINAMSEKLSQKLNGQRLELTIEQVPLAFSLVDKAHLLLMVIHWDHIYMEPDFKDLIVSYKLFQFNNVVKTGKIDIANTEKNKETGFFQSWKSSITQYVAIYNGEVANMSHAFVHQLIEEL